eukprot:COSAG01_NODE_519_length_16012_cov_4.344058_2_plen_134_part_00
MSIFLRHRKDPIRIEFAPLLDIIFVLLIFFAVSSSLILQKQGIELRLPKAKTVNTQKKGIGVYVDKRQRIFIDDKKIRLSKFDLAIKKVIKQQANLQIILSADKQTPYQLILTLMDRIRRSGCYDIVLAAEKF